MRIFEFLISPDDDTLGMSCISLVDKPAMESEFLAFNKQNVKQRFVSLGESKRIVAGLALIPDKLVYRIDEETSEEYMGYFSADTIEMIRNKFMRDKNTDNVNLQHNADAKIGAYLVETYLLNTEARASEVKAMGIEDARLGALYVAYKFSNTPEAEQAYQDALSGKYTGFSVEVMLQRELKLNKNNNKNNYVMTKINKLIDKFKTILQEFEEVTLEDANLADGSGALRYTDIAAPVLKVVVAEDGTETTEPMPVGEYILDNGKILVVDDMGNLLEVKEGAPAPVLPEGMMTPEEIEAKRKLKCDEDEAARLAALAELPPLPEEVPPVADEVPPVADVTKKTLGEIIDVTKDGEYYIVVTVSGGAITEATVEAEQNLIQVSEFEAAKAEIVTLKAQLSKPVTKSITEFSVPRQETATKDELAKMNNLQLVKHRLNLK